ncbi:hypothetical protein [Lacisediminihabitans changchengi]|uniref:Uncharacterized protein n=1 Tax=Lacisediminihabitans changchengi TaxID=2787634 RepID=A0A934W1V7_9MICO|nr:hypothetical protein [Lacisediminihabitans changchengi]MBK4346186.1 hypothetical protein [Lacisediminihabitans changchengi]
MSTPEPRYFPGRTALVALVLAIVGAGLGYGGFISGVDAALGGRLSDASIVIFYVGTGLLVVAVVLSIVGLLRTSAKVLSTVALVVALIPIAGLIVAALGARH